jgi:hypothetical protein
MPFGGSQDGPAVRRHILCERNDLRHGRQDQMVTTSKTQLLATKMTRRLEGVCHIVESLMLVRRLSQLKSCGGDDFAPRLHG